MAPPVAVPHAVVAPTTASTPPASANPSQVTTVALLLPPTQADPPKRLRFYPAERPPCMQRAALLSTLRREARDSLRSVEDRLTTKGIRVATDVRIGDPAAEILAECDRTGADLIAMATHGRSGLGRLVFGSVAETVIRNAR